jgi:hypothetical protein
VIRTLARYHVMLWLAGLALLAIGVAWIAPRPYDDGGLGSLSYSLTFSLGFPFVTAARLLVRWLGPERAGLTWPLAIPLGLIPYILAEILVQRLSRRVSTNA